MIAPEMYRFLPLKPIVHGHLAAECPPRAGDAADGFVDRVTASSSPSRPCDVVGRDGFPGIAATAMADLLNTDNPQQVRTGRDIKAALKMVC